MSTRCWSAAAVLAVAMGGCKEPGAIAVTSSLRGQPCVDGASVIVYAVPGAVCGAVTCGAYFDACDEDCVVACPAGCGPDELEGGIDLAPPPGRYAIVIDYVDDQGLALATACAQATIEADGTSSAELVAEGVCCEPAP